MKRLKISAGHLSRRYRGVERKKLYQSSAIFTLSRGDLLICRFGWRSRSLGHSARLIREHDNPKIEEKNFPNLLVVSVIRCQLFKLNNAARVRWCMYVQIHSQNGRCRYLIVGERRKYNRGSENEACCYQPAFIACYTFYRRLLAVTDGNSAVEFSCCRNLCKFRNCDENLSHGRCVCLCNIFSSLPFSTRLCFFPPVVLFFEFEVIHWLTLVPKKIGSALL